MPKLVLHTFAENAVKHGILPGKKDGLLIIRGKREKDYLILCIEDNGVGRKEAKGKSRSTGKGLKLTTELYDILNQLNNRKITYSIVDLYSESGEASGTRIEVWVPTEAK